MVAALTAYTTYDDIRAALGVSTEDADDATLALALYADCLELELKDIDASLPALYASTKIVISPSDAQLALLQACRLYATYAVAKHLTTSLPMFAVKQISDSKATAVRFDSPYVDVIASVTRMCDRMRSKVEEALTGLGGAAAVARVAQVYLGVSSPTTDRVTGV